MRSNNIDYRNLRKITFFGMPRFHKAVCMASITGFDVIRFGKDQLINLREYKSMTAAK